ncbi:MAG: hypothetical protein IIA45_15295 [Bacteroidetes bacterium]|nr:hypothetical protein [Bacteroidota bacterium]
MNGRVKQVVRPSSSNAAATPGHVGEHQFDQENYTESGEKIEVNDWAEYETMDDNRVDMIRKSETPSDDDTGAESDSPE